jgi:hypothetical protein
MQKRIWNSIMKTEIMRAEDFRIEKIVQDWKEILK